MRGSLAHSTTSTTPFRGPSNFNGRNQYYDVLNHFFCDGQRKRVFAGFKRLTDKGAWGAPEWKEGLEIDRVRLIKEWDLDNANARMDELVRDGCEIYSFWKNPAPGGRVSYLLVSWPMNSELERNRSARVASKQPKQQKLPRAATPFQHPAVRIEAPDWYTRQTGKPRPANRQAEADCFVLTSPEAHR